MRQGAGSAVALFAGVLVAAGGLGWLLYAAGGPSSAPVGESGTPKDPHPAPPPPPAVDLEHLRVEPVRKPRPPSPGSEAKFPFEGHDDINLRDWKAAAEAFLDYAAVQREMAVRGKPAFSDEKFRDNVLRKGTRFGDVALGPPPGWSGAGTLVKLEHPAVGGNLLAASLDRLKLPLTDAQGRRIGDLVKERGAALDAWDAETAADATSYRIERLAGRAAIVANFWAEVFSVLTPAQAEAVSPAEFRDRLSLDFLSSAVVWFGAAQKLPYAGDKELVASMTESMATQFSLEVQKEELRSIVEAWVRDNPNEPEDVIEHRGPLKVSRVERAARRMVELLRTINERLKPPSDKEAAVRSAGLYVPIPN